MMEQWVVYCGTKDIPAAYVVRRFFIGAGQYFPDRACATASTLEEARLIIPEGLHRLERDPRDDPSILEVWI